MFGDLTLGVVILAALLDSINPCVLGVLIFLITYMMTVVYKDPKKMLFVGLVYVCSVYITYLAIGFGLLKVASQDLFSDWFYWGASIIAIIAGVLEIKDYFWYGRGFSLQMIPGGAERVKFYTAKLAKFEKKNLWASFLIALFLGFFVVLVEFPCTGAPYLAILALLATGEYSRAVPFLLIYNLVFVIPLVVIIFLVYFGKSSEVLEEWRIKHKRLMRLLVGVFLLTLGFWMLWTVLPAGVLPF